MIKNFDKFTGINVIDMFSVMYAPSIIRAAARNKSLHDRFMILAKKYCKEDINIKGMYPYAYLKSQRGFNKDTSIIFLYGKSNNDKTDIPLYKIIHDTYIGDTIMYIYIDALENCKDIDIFRDLISEINFIIGNNLSIEVFIGAIATNDKLYKEYKNNWNLEIFGINNTIGHSKQKLEMDHLIDLYRETTSNEVVREINYGDTDYTELRDVCIIYF